MVEPNRRKIIKEHGVLSPQEQTAFQEYYVMLVLKSLFSNEYAGLMKKKEDRPDLRTMDDSFGVEVTTADSFLDNQINREFSKYVLNKDVRRKKTIEKGNCFLDETGVGISVCSGGGYDVRDDKYLLINQIKRKIESAQKYPKKYPRLELAILKRELLPSIWQEGIFDFITEAIDENNCIFKKIFVLYRDKCYCYGLDGSREEFIIKNKEDIEQSAYLLAVKEMESKNKSK